jgi:hypothetical protein
MRMMNLRHRIWVLAIAGSVGTIVFGADREVKVDDRLDASADTLNDMMRAADKGIPQDLLNKAHCVVVVPGMKKPDSSSAQSMAVGSPYAVGMVDRAGPRRLRCALKVAVSDFKLALLRRMSCYS